MSDRTDRKLQEVAIAKFRYRHEAEFAAGFLDEAGIPYRLQMDDAGGVEFGLSGVSPAVLWVRGMDERRARELLDVEEQSEAAAGDSSSRPSPVRRGDSRVVGIERVVSGGMALVAALTAYIAPSGSVLGAICLLLALFLGAAALFGRAPAALRLLLRTLSGRAP